MDEMIVQAANIRSALLTLEITSTRHNMEIILGSVQALDRMISRMKKMEEEHERDHQD